MATIIKEVDKGNTRQLNMAQFEALSEIYDYDDYDIIDYPQDGATNEQMTFALTCNRLFPAGTTILCKDDGAYIKGHTYIIEETDGVKSWVDITQTITTTQTISSTSTSEEIPSAKAVYDYINSLNATEVSY